MVFRDVALLVAVPVLVLWFGCAPDTDPLLPARTGDTAADRTPDLVVRFIQVTDTHTVDEESPARFAGAHRYVHAAWRPQEAYSTQILDGLIRAVNRTHAGGRTIDFLLHTGDACDNAQSNELAWFLGILDGQWIDPRSGPDDRPPDTRPDPLLDPQAPFQAQGLYRNGVHGEAPTIPWYVVAGNHETYAIGVFPILESSTGHRTAPLPLDVRPGLLLPVVLDPVASFAHGNVTPAEPGPPELFEPPRPVVPNAARAYFDRAELQQALCTTLTAPAGHGLGAAVGKPAWYTLSPAPGVRLIALDTTDWRDPVKGGIYSEGALSRTQLEFLRTELETARTAGELVMVATHHPSEALAPFVGNDVTPAEFRALLRSYPEVVLHVAGHTHRNRVVDRGGYVEIETCALIDWPQEARVIEIRRAGAAGDVAVSYEMLSHLADPGPPLGDDPLRALRQRGWELAAGSKPYSAHELRSPGDGADPAGRAGDRDGVVLLRRSTQY